MNCDNGYLIFKMFPALAVSLAIFRDGGSGGCVRIAAIEKDGIQRQVILGNELPQFYPNV